MSEVTCEGKQNCDQDQPSFKAYLSRWLAVTTQLAPQFHDQIMVKINASAQGAAKQCSGPAIGTNGGRTIDGTTCGRRWYQSSYDGQAGVGESMSALSVIGKRPGISSPLSLHTQYIAMH
jgi:mannan endo-1,6-alpha-mannosidase